MSYLSKTRPQSRWRLRTGLYTEPVNRSISPSNRRRIKIIPAVTPQDPLRFPGGRRQRIQKVSCFISAKVGAHDGASAHVVGDIHGCFDEYIRLETKIYRHARMRAGSPTVCVGDLVDRGPDSAKVVATSAKVQLPVPMP